MVFDIQGGALYLYGGWDGKVDLPDFWKYDIHTRSWTMIAADTTTVGGPGARSCHKMVIDGTRRVIYTLGRYIDIEFDARALDDRPPGDFYSYDIATDKWTLLSSDTESEGGPPLVYDHQIAIDEQRMRLYVFGGRMISPRVQDPYVNT